MSDAPQILLDHRLKSLRLPTVLREYSTLAKQAEPDRVYRRQFSSYSAARVTAFRLS